MKMRIIDIIELVDMRNKNLVSDKPMGISIDKYFMPSVANTIGVDLKTYKLVPHNCFACNLMHVGRDERVPLAINKKEDPVLVSPAYLVFRVKESVDVLPDFLMLWFRCPTFDRNAWFFTAGDVRGGLDKKDFFNMEVHVPDIATQRRIVAEYQAVEKRIATNERLIAKLEETAQTIYKKMFVDDIDPEHLPDGWRMGYLSDIVNVSSGKSLTDKVDSPSGRYIYPVAGASGIIGYSKAYNQEDVFLTTGRVGTIGVVNRYYTKSWTADNVLVIKSDYLEYSYHILTNIRYEDIIKGGVQALVTQTDLNNVVSIVPPKSFLLDFEKKTSILSESIRLMKAENRLLDNMKSLMLGKMSKL